MGVVPDGDKSPAPPWLNNGDNSWQMTAATLVALQSLSGLSAMYAGLVKKKWSPAKSQVCRPIYQTALHSLPIPRNLEPTRHTMAQGLAPALAIGASILSAGFFVSQAASSHPIGSHIPDKRLELRDQGAQGDAVSAGKKKPEEAVNDVSVKIKGGDKGLKEVTTGEGGTQASGS